MASASLTTAGKEPLVPYVVKWINGRPYVYFQQRIEGRVVTEYIGPLVRIVEFYLKYKDKLEVVPRPGFEPGFSGSRGRHT